MKSLTYIEVDVVYCSLTYGSSPCMASVGVTGDAKCFNTRKTCQDRENFGTSTVTLRYAIPTDYLPSNIECIPSIKAVAYSPATISLGENLGQRATLEVTFEDHRHSDTGQGGDKYLADRAYDPFKQGTYWGKFRARHPYVRGNAMRLIRGFVGDALADMETHHFIVESFDGPGADGSYKLIAKDVLKLADSDRAQAPRLSNGYLVADITDAASTLTLTPSGIGDLEYNASGYVAIGGKEICAYYRDTTEGNDANCLLLLHFDGADGATSTTDSSSSARTATRNGNTVLEADEKKFGTTSSVFDGAGDYWQFPDHASWTFSGDFTLECWANLTNMSVARTLLCHSTDINNMYRLYVTTDGRLKFDVVSASSTIVTAQSTASAVSAVAWHHLAVVRNGNVFTLYIDGVANGTTTDSDAIPNFSSFFKVGISGNGSSDPMLGYIDEVRVSNVARWTSGFTPPAAPYGTDSDMLVLTRAQYNTTAQAHKAESRVQKCLLYTGEDPADILYDLFVTYAGVPSGYISLEEWQAETATFLQRVYTTLIAEPTGVNQLASELIEQAALACWWDALTQKVRLQVLRAVSTDAEQFAETNMIAGSLVLREQPEKRLSQVWTYYAQRNPLESLENEDNFKSTLATIDAQAETDYGSSAIKKIFSRWIPEFGRAVATRANQITLGRFRDPPRAITFDVFRADGQSAPLTGGSYNIASTFIQDDSGAPTLAPVQVTRLKPDADKWSVECEEILFTDQGSVDLSDRVVSVDANTFDFNLQAVHDTLYPTLVDGAGITLTCIIAAGVKVGATSTAEKAFDVGSWPSGLTINLINRGRIQGAGGAGGKSSGTAAGKPGGTALYTRYSLNLDNTGGEIWGGGGGGGGGVGLCGGGGGGAGTVPGAGGDYDHSAGSGIGPGSPGTGIAGGAGGPGFSSGGAGGGPGLTGAGAPVVGGTAGAAGKAIDGISYITVSVAGDRRGSEVN